MLKITLNKPAEQNFLDSKTIKGIRFRATPTGVEFQPVTRISGEGVVPLTTRSRGGVELLIDGPVEEMLTASLRNEFGFSHFYLTKSSRKDWIATIPYEGPAAHPPRVKPHLRVWGRTPIVVESTRASAQGSFNLQELADEVRRAREIIRNAQSEPRVGRKPSELVSAEKTIALLHALMAEIADLSALSRAARDISRVVDDFGVNLVDTSSGHPVLEAGEPEAGAVPDFTEMRGSVRETIEGRKRKPATGRRRSKSTSSSASA